MGFSLFFGFCCAGLAREAGTITSSMTVTAENNLGKKRLILIIQKSSVRFHGAGLQQKCDAVGAVYSFPAFAFLWRHFPGAHGFKREGPSLVYCRVGLQGILRALHKIFLPW